MKNVTFNTIYIQTILILIFIFVSVFIFVHYYTNYLFKNTINSLLTQLFEENKQKTIDDINTNTTNIYQTQKSNFEDFLSNIF